MGDINMQLVREFFELHGYHALTHWPHESARSRATDPSALLFVEQLNSTGECETPDFLLRGEDVPQLKRAVIEVRAWHADRFYPSVIEGNAILAHVASAEVKELGLDIFGTDKFSTVLVISEFPASFDARDRALALLKQSGLSHVLEFPTMLQDMLLHISANANYAPSPTLQCMRLLKRYGFIRRQQLEFSFPLEGGTVETRRERD